MEQDRLCSALEAMLFAAEHPVPVDRFVTAFGEEAPPSQDDVREALGIIRARYLAGHFGFELREAQSGFHFVTKVENAEYVRRFLATKPFRLSRSALEVLSIIAYRQPVTRAELDSVRGIDSSHILRVLIERDLVRMAGKAEIPGRPVVYATTQKFLEVVGLPTLNDLPPLSELDQLQGHTVEREDPMETGLDRFMQTSQEAEKIDEENQAEYREIHAMLEDVGKADKEVYESQTHADVAAENQASLEAHQSTTPRRSRKKTAEVRYEDLVVSETVIEGAGVALELPAEGEDGVLTSFDEEPLPEVAVAGVEMEGSVDAPTEMPTDGEPEPPEYNA